MAVFQEFTMKRHVFSLPFAVLLLASLACNGVVATPDMNTISTSIAQTFAVTLTALGATSAPVSTETPQPPTLTYTPITPLPTFTPTATFPPPATFTPLVPQISVSVATNCRSGPGKVYPLMGGLPQGVVVQVFGRDPSGNYWYIRNPDRPNRFCWVWGEYATVTGNISLVPILTPPPTPTATLTPTATATFTPKPAPKFNISFSGLEVCKSSKKWWVEFEIKNTGDFALRSITIMVLDADKGITKTRTMDGFDSRNGCAATSHRAILQKGKSVIVSSDAFGYNLKGRNLRAWVVICVQNNQGQPCAQKIINFTP